LHNHAIRIQEEIHMLTRSAFMSARCIIGAVTVACAMCAGNVIARDHTGTVSVPVSTRGLDLSRATDAQILYRRLQNAAWVVCTRGTRVDLLPSDDPVGCYERALGNAVRSANIPAVTQIYLGAHTLR
jgi:UrcA family protein